MKLNRNKTIQGSLILAALSLAVLFQNCSGSQFQSSVDSASTVTPSGSGDSSTPSPNPSPSPAPGPAPSPSPNPSPSPGSSTYSLNIAKSGSGTVTSNPAGIQCGSICSGTFSSGSSVTLTATAASGFVFKGWGGACGGANPACTVSMDDVRNVTVNFESTGTAPTSIDDVIASMPSNSWKSLPSTQMKDVCPLPYNHYLCEAVVSAWSGGTFDTQRDHAIIYGGGHGDSYYNNVFSFDLVNMRWSRLTEMQNGATGDSAPSYWSDKRTETCGFNTKAPLILPSDFALTATGYVPQDKCFVDPVLSQLDFQQPRSAHTYGMVVYDRVKDRYCSLASTFYPSAQAGSNSVPCFNPKTGLWERAADRPMNSTIGGYGTTMVDANGHFWNFAGQQGDIGEYDPVANTWKIRGTNNGDAGGGLDVDRKRNKVLGLIQTGSTTQELRSWDISNASAYLGEKSYTVLNATGDQPPFLGTRPGFVYVDGMDKFFAWGGGRDVYSLDPVTSTWKRLAASGDDPGPQQQWGTYGRFRYSPNKKIFILINSTEQNVFIYKP